MTDYVKYQALGNDYIVIDPNRSDLVPTPESVRLLCDRHFGIGADGVLFGPLGRRLPEQRGTVELRLFNSDGSECEKSGNGLRMFALYVAANYPTGPEFTVRTPAGDSPVEIADPRRGLVKVAMGRPSFNASEVPVLGVHGPATEWPLVIRGQTLTVTSVNVGNPHTVVPVEEVSRQMTEELGPAIARHPRFPRGTNVQFLRVLDRAGIQIEIWERGSGYTLASGSSGCAAACVARALGLVDDSVAVTMPGGRLEVSFDGHGSITMTGVAEQVSDGRFAPAFRERLGLPARRRVTRRSPHQAVPTTDPATRAGRARA